MPTAPPPTQSRFGTGIPLERFRDDARDLPAADFEDRHGAGFLLLTATPLQLPSGPAMTEVHLDDDSEPGSGITADIALLVFPLVRGERSAGHLITLGRTSNNDVVIPDLSVSRFHAFVKPAAAGGFQIQDANSTNGSTLNGNTVAAQGHGSATDLKSGDNVRLGQVEFTYLTASALRDFVRAHR